MRIVAGIASVPVGGLVGIEGGIPVVAVVAPVQNDNACVRSVGGGDFIGNRFVDGSVGDFVDRRDFAALVAVGCRDVDGSEAVGVITFAEGYALDVVDHYRNEIPGFVEYVESVAGCVNCDGGGAEGADSHKLLFHFVRAIL